MRRNSGWDLISPQPRLKSNRKAKKRLAFQPRLLNFSIRTAHIRSGSSLLEAPAHNPPSSLIDLGHYQNNLAPGQKTANNTPQHQSRQKKLHTQNRTGISSVSAY